TKLGLRGRGAAGVQLLAGRSGAATDAARMGTLGTAPRQWQAVSARHRSRFLARSGRCPWTRLSHAAELPRDYEVQPRRGLRARDRTFRRPAAWRRPLRPAMAAR